MLNKTKMGMTTLPSLLTYCEDQMGCQNSIWCSVSNVYLHLSKKEQTSDTTNNWDDSKDIMLSERNQSQMVTHYMIPLVSHSQVKLQWWGTISDCRKFRWVWVSVNE